MGVADPNSTSKCLPNTGSSKPNIGEYDFRVETLRKVQTLRKTSPEEFPPRPGEPVWMEFLHVRRVGLVSCAPSLSRVPGSVLEALADLVDRLLGHELGAGVDIGGGDAAVDLQVELRHWPEALDERLLTER